MFNQLRIPQLILTASFIFIPTLGQAQSNDSYYPTECAAGVWDYVSLDAQPNGRYTENKASGVRYCLFDSTVRMEEFRYLSDSGAVTFRGVSFHLLSDDQNNETTLWAMVGDMGVTLIEGEIVEGVLRNEAAGSDNGGQFIARSTITYPTSESYLFLMDRTYDGGENWITPFNRIEGQKIAEMPPSLPTAYAAEIIEKFPNLRGNGTWHLTKRRVHDDGAVWLGYAEERVSIILDGYAQLSEITEYNRDRSYHQRIIRITTLDADGDGLRTVEWVVGSDEYYVDTVSQADENVSRLNAKTDVIVATRVHFEQGENFYRTDFAYNTGAAENIIGHQTSGVGEKYNVPTEVPIDQSCSGYGFTLGHWQLNASSMNQSGGQNPGVGYVYGYTIHEGYARAAEMHVIFEDGTGFRGTTFRTYNPQQKQWYITWITDGTMTQPSGISESDNPQLCEEVWSNQQDQYGAFETRLRLVDITPQSFDVFMDRVYTEGEGRTIPNLWSYSARRIR